MANVFSQSFIMAHAASSGSNNVVVPSGYVFVVKFLSVYYNTIGGGTVFFKQKTSNVALRSWSAGPFSKVSVGELVTIAFNQGEEFGFEIDAIDPSDRMDVYAGGYALTLP